MHLSALVVIIMYVLNFLTFGFQNIKLICWPTSLPLSKVRVVHTCIYKTEKISTYAGYLMCSIPSRLTVLT